MKKFVPFIFYNKNCPACGTKRSIVFKNYMGQEKEKIDQSVIYEVYCSICKHEYIILWDDDKPSLADKDLSINAFEKEFIQNEKRDIDDILF